MIGQIVSHYRVEAPLGEGGMGVVYRGVDITLDRPVALKVLPADTAGDPERRRRFLQEARAASALNDPHIVTIHQILTHGDVDVIVMELVQGRTLRDLMRDGPVPIAQALDLVTQAAEALGVAHAAGIVHRDLKPGNLMVTPRGLLKILDFGLAKIVTDARRQDGTTTTTQSGPLTTFGAILGTIEYMSPEQALGKPVDHRSDIFSLGAMLYELVGGARPFAAEHPASVLHQVIYETPRAVRELRPDIPAGIAAVVSKALEKRPEDRFASMEEMGAAVRRERHALETGVPTRVPRRRRPAAVRIAVLGIAAAVAAAVLAVPATRSKLMSAIAGRPAPRRSVMPEPASVAQPTTPHEYVQLGLGLLQRFDRPGNVDKAIAAFDAAIERDRKFAPAWAGLATAYWRQGVEKRDESWRPRAVEAARQAVALDAYLAAGHAALGIALVASGDHAAAAKSFESVLVLDPASADAHRGLGEIALAQGRHQEAETHYKKAASLRPEDWELTWLVGTAAYRSGRYRDAVTWYQRAATLAPDSAHPYLLLGAAHHMLGDYAAAAKALQQSIAIRPTPSGYSNLGTALFFEGRYGDSVAAFEKGVELRPNDPLMWGNLGDAYRWTPGRRPEARNAYLRAIQLLEPQVAKDPKNVRDRSRLALYLAKYGDHARAQKELRGIEDLATRDTDTLYRAAVTGEVVGDRAAALRWLGAALDKGISVREVVADPELAGLRSDVRYHRLILRFQARPPDGGRAR